VKKLARTLVLTLAVAAASFGTGAGCTTEQRGGRTTGQYIDDKTLNAKVRSALNGSTEYKFSDVKVETMGGVVQLSGFVASGAQKSRAAEIIARSVNGVQRVENQISIKQ
jgi:osmotically-inducible protein OsmY